MLKIYAIPVSLYCAKLRILLRHKQLQWSEHLPPGGYGSSEYKKIVPSANLPCLVDGDLMLADSEAIAEYLNEKFTTPPMLPADINLRAKIRELSRFHDTRLEPELRALFPHISPEKRNRDIALKQSEKITLRLQQLAPLLVQVLAQAKHDRRHQQLTLADCGYPVSFTWIDALAPAMELQIDWPDEVTSYRNHIESHTSIASELDDYRPKVLKLLAPATSKGPEHKKARTS